jgi:hypothetical protein
MVDFADFLREAVKTQAPFAQPAAFFCRNGKNRQNRVGFCPPLVLSLMWLLQARTAKPSRFLTPPTASLFFSVKLRRRLVMFRTALLESVRALVFGSARRSSARPRRSPPVQRTRLCLEALEERDLPSATPLLLTAPQGNSSSAVGKQVNSPSVVASFAVSSPVKAIAGSAFNVTITALDQYGNTANYFIGTVHFTSSDPQALLPADYTFVPGDQGVHTFSLTAYTAGSQKITATAKGSGSSAVTGTSVISVFAAGPASINISGVPATVTAGNSFNVTITATDPYGNGCNSLVTLSGAGQSWSVLTSNGTGSISITLTTAQTFKLIASSGSVFAGTSVTVIAAAPTVAVSGLPATMTVGQSATVTITVQDQFGNVYANTPVILDASSSADLSVSGNKVLTNSSGQAMFVVTAIQSGNVNGAKAILTVDAAGASGSAITIVYPSLYTATETVVAVFEDSAGNVYALTNTFTSAADSSVKAAELDVANQAAIWESAVAAKFGYTFEYSEIVSFNIVAGN